MATRTVNKSRSAARLASQIAGNTPYGKTKNDPLSDVIIALGGRMFAGEDSKQPGGDSWGSLKSFGKGILNVLSVPGAATVTSLTNAIRAAKGDPLVSWKNMAGTFRGDKYAGGAALLETLGVDNATAKRWGGLGLDILIDPTWALGVGALAKAGKLSKMFPAANAAAAARFAHKATAAQLARDTGPLMAEGRVGEVFKSAMAADLEKAQARAAGVVPAVRFGIGRKTVEGVRVPRGLQVPLWHKPIFTKDIGKITPGMFKLSPLGEVTARGSDRARSVGEASIKQIQHDMKDIPADVFGRVGAVMSAGDRRAARTALIDMFKAQGSWDAQHDKVLRYFTQIGRRQAKQLGLKTFRQQAAIMRRFRDKQNAELAAFRAETLAGIATKEQALAKFHEGVVRRRNAALESLRQQAETQRAYHAGQVAAAQRAAGVATARSHGLAQRVAATRAALAAKHNDPDYVASLAANWTGKRMGPNKIRVRAQVQARRAQLEAELKSFEEQLAEAEKVESSLVGAHKKALSAAKRSADDAQKKAQDIIDEFDRVAEREGNKLAERIDKRTGDRAAQEEALTGKQLAAAKAFAVSERLSEFGNKTARWRAKGQRLVPRGQAKFDLNTLDQIDKKIGLMGQWINYFHHAPDRQVLREIEAWRAEQTRLGHLSPSIMGSSEYFATKVMRRREAESPFEAMTKEDTIKQMVRAGVPEAEATEAAAVLEGFYKFLPKPKPYSKDMPGITWRADINALSATTTREGMQYHTMLKHQMDGMLRDLFPGKDVKGMWEDLTVQYRTGRIPGSPAALFGLGKLRDPETGKKVLSTVPRVVIATAWLKAWFTVMNPGHYVMNAVGSFINDLIEGNWRHLLTGYKSALPGHVSRKLGRFDAGSDVMNQVFKLGDIELTGAQLATYARLSGLGIGYTQAEIEMVAHVFSGKGKTTGIARLMNKLNMDRENADRVWSWMNHIKAGDDPFTAASRVIRTKFDYNAATHFEKIWMRNLLLFYTWYKNNLILQGYGILTRPGVYSTFNHIEHSRPKLEGEPTWWKRAGGVYSPWGLITFGNPLSDVYKYAVTQENFRQNVLGAMTPFVQTPISLMTGKDMFTGGDLSKFADQNTPSPLGYVLNPLHIGAPSRSKAGGESSPAVPWWLAKVVKDFTGPYGMSISSVTSRPDVPNAAWYNVYPRVTGARLNPVDQVEWERALKARQIKRKADLTRKRTYESPQR